MDHSAESVSQCCSTGEGDELERNPAYQTSASLIPSSTNPSYAAGLNMTTNTQVYEDVSAL